MKRLIQLLTLIAFPFLVGVMVTSNKPPAADKFLPTDYPEHLDGAFTGGFGEETCRSCHFDYDLNMEGGTLDVNGLDQSYTPGEEIAVTVTVQSEHLEIAGFQMSARFEDGSQAGEFTWDGDDLMFTADTDSTVQYIQHSENGLIPETGRLKRWDFIWAAPQSGGEIIFNVAANAGNYDDSSFGDWIYVKEITLKPAGM